MRFKRMLSVGSVLGVSAAAVFASAPGASGASTDLSLDTAEAVTGSVEVEQVTEAAKEAVEGYWTPDRMASATPVEKSLPENAAPQARDNVSPQQRPDAQQRSNRGATNSPASKRQDPADSPHVGKVFFSTAQGDFVCSGNLVESENQSTVSTAGHCLHDGAGGDFATNFAFAPAFDHGESEHGVWAAEELATTSQWAEDSEFDFDVGFAVMETKDGTTIEEQVGESSPIVFNQPRNEFYSVYGYPAAERFNGQELYLCQGDALDEPFGGDSQGVRCNMTGGTSGGPWFLGDGPDGAQNSVNSYKYLSDSNTLYGPYFGSDVQEVYETISAR